jgi:flagellar assembly protein FliH
LSSTAYLRATRRAAEVLLGLDGRANREPVAPKRSPLEDEADAIVEAAQRQAEELIDGARVQAAAMQHDGYRDGREQGYRDGVAEARGELAEALALVQRVAGEAATMRERLLWGAERDIIELVIAATKNVVGEQVRLDPSLVMDTVERALERAGAQNVVRVRVSPDDRGRVEVALAERHGDAPPFQMVGDHAVAVGGCIVDTTAGEVDARLDVQLDEVARVLREAVPEDERLHATRSAR